jgi:hypothetical protein
MLEPDQWDSVLGSVTGTIYRGTERISSNALLNALEVGPDPVARQKVAKRIFRPPFVRPDFPELCGSMSLNRAASFAVRCFCRRTTTAVAWLPQ